MTKCQSSIEGNNSATSSFCFSLPPHLFGEIFPFHLVFDRNSLIVQIGSVLQRICPALSLGKSLYQHFRLLRPKIQIEFNTIQKHSRSLFLLESLDNRIQLKGQMVYCEQSEVIFFIGSPWITEIAAMKSFGLTLKDFATHDPIVDFLFLLQAQNNALSESKELTVELTKQRTELSKTTKRLAAQYAATHALAECSTLSEAAIKLIAAICEAFDWQIGVFWEVDEQAKLLRCKDIWKDTPDQFTDFESINRMLTLAPGVALSGYAWLHGKPVWSVDITTDCHPLRLHAAEVGLHRALSFPIKIGSQVIGVFEFFGRKAYEPDEDLFALLADVSIKIGQSVQRRQIEEALLKQTEIAESLKLILDSMGDAVIVADENQNFLVFNPAAERMFSVSSANLSDDKHPQCGFYSSNFDTSSVIDKLPIQRAIKGDDIDNLEIFMHHHKDLDSIWVMITGRPLKDKNGVLKGGVIVCRDITKRKQVEEKLLHNTFHDGLTGLPNRAFLTERLRYAISQEKRRDNYLFAVLFLDLDRFKVINDSLGHVVGDQLLIAFSQRIMACLRAEDTFARLGGDEFVILLENIKDSSHATKIAERIQDELRLPFSLSEQEVFIGVSIGITMSTTNCDQPENILRNADIAMYEAKALGKACHQVFDERMHIRAMALLQLETDLRRAVEGGEFQIHYQPIVALQTGRLAGLEALIRWYHPQRKLVSPAEFIPVAEETGLIIPIGWWVLREACRQMRVWHVQFPLSPPLTISVNISGKQFSQPGLIEQIEQILQETGLDAHSLKLEITESVLVENPESATIMLLQLQALGIRLSIDDFGTGYSSLSYLSRFPIDTLKIDRSFIDGMDIDAEKIEIVRTILALACNLGMDVVAEGVETKKQLHQLNVLNCDFGQGYFFSKPLDSETTEALIAEQAD